MDILKSHCSVLLPGMAVAGLVFGSLALSSCATRSATKTAIVRAPLFSPAFHREATNAVDAGDEDLELAGLRRDIATHPDDVEIRLKLAQAYSAHGFTDVALEHYRLAAERFPASERAAVRLAKALHSADQTEAALHGLQTFIKAHPQNLAEPYEWLGILNDDLLRWRDSELAYRTALLYAPQNPELHNNLGYTYLMQHRNEDAATEFHQALRLKKDLAIARNNLGIALADTPNEAILNWQSVSGPAAAHNNMGALLLERGDFAGARKEIEAALGYDRQNAQAIYNLALVAQRDGKPAVIPQQTTLAAKDPAKRIGFFGKIFHARQHTHKPNQGQEVASGAHIETTPHPGNVADQPVPLRSGSGN